MISALKNLPYKDRLKACNMSTLHYRRVRGDMIETYKILSGKYDTTVVPHLKTTGIQVTRGEGGNSKLVLNMTCASFILLIE